MLKVTLVNDYKKLPTEIYTCTTYLVKIHDKMTTSAVQATR